MYRDVCLETEGNFIEHRLIEKMIAVIKEQMSVMHKLKTEARQTHES